MEEKKMNYIAHCDGEREQSILEHLQGTAEKAKDFAEVFEKGDWGYCCGMLHDIGKYSDKFQRRIRGEEIKVDHATAGARVCMELGGMYPFLEMCIAGHHAGLSDYGVSTDTGNSSTTLGRRKKKIEDFYAYKKEVKIPELKTSPVNVEKTKDLNFSLSMFTRMMYSCLVDADFLDTEEFMTEERSGRQQGQEIQVLLDKLEKYITEWLKNTETESVNGRRTEILKACLENGEREKGLFRLTVPTGGGKTEAYLGLMAFVIANRRLRADENDEYNRDGGVTAILRYTLRLLTTQQRDRITKMILAAEFIRQKEYPKYGKEPISIGFWVGGTVTPNTFKELEEDPEDPAKTRTARSKKNAIYKQLLTCPFCGKPLTEENFYIDIPTKSVSIYCSDDKCMFYRYKPSNKIKIPVYLVDEEIYAKCPTIILSTVDKFARLPWDVNTNALFGRVDRICSRDGYVAIGADHARHTRTEELPTATLRSIKPFLPPELIIQDELHLITGPLGTVYGAYETVIEDLCSYTIGEKKIKPKYVVSTATIKNAAEQTKCLYGRKVTAQFPPNGFEIGDSFYIREVPVEQDPFRRYVGVCAPGQSVKTALLRVYSIILQSAYNLSLDDEYKDVIDPYYTLVGYYNSIRELGGAVRLLQDDIPDRIQRIKKKYGMSRQRFLNHKVEITSRMSSYDIPKKLSQLETPYTDRNCLDTAIATNMIAVGMDVDRLGLMVVTGQPKQNSEYIQATSRIGRSYPGLVVTLYNPYRPRDLSHYENFTGYHAQLYRFVEGTTATPFSARARDRVLHALVISAIRLHYPEFASNDGAAAIDKLTDEQLNEVKALIMNRLNIIKPSAKADAEHEIDDFISNWKLLATQSKELRYYVYTTKTYNRLMNTYGEVCTDLEKPTLRSMRDVERAANMFYYTED